MKFKLIKKENFKHSTQSIVEINLPFPAPPTHIKLVPTVCFPFKLKTHIKTNKTPEHRETLQTDILFTFILVLSEQPLRAFSHKEDPLFIKIVARLSRQHSYFCFVKLHFSAVITSGWGEADKP